MSKKTGITLLIFILLFTCSWYVKASDENLFSFYHNEIKYMNHLFVDNRGDLNSGHKITNEEIDSRLFHLFRYSMRMRTAGVDPRRRFKDSVAIIMHETRFVNFRSVDDGAGFGWFSMHKTHIRTLDNYFNFTQYNFDTILNSDKLQAKYVIANYLYLMEIYQDRFKAILGYNRGANGVRGEKRHEDYLFRVLGLIAYYDAKLRE